MASEYSGSGDPARSLALMWRTREPPSRGPKPGLSVDGIVRAAIALADADGLAGLSMRRVAERFGVGTMSLYTYVPGKAELLDAMLDAAYGEVARLDDPDGEWRARLEQVARENWALYHRHPWMLQFAAGRMALGPNLIAKYDRELRTVDGLGLSDVEMDSVLTLVLGHVEASARRAREAAGAERRTGMTDQQWWDAHAPLLERLFDADRHPTAARVGSAAGAAHQAAYPPEHAFEFGLRCVLDGVAALVRSRA